MSAPSILYKAPTRESETYVLSPQRRRHAGRFHRTARLWGGFPRSTPGTGRHVPGHRREYHRLRWMAAGWTGTDDIRVLPVRSGFGDAPSARRLADQLRIRRARAGHALHDHSWRPSIPSIEHGSARVGFVPSLGTVVRPNSLARAEANDDSQPPALIRQCHTG